mmetsp:Transcript_51143/g.118869  ORF Transcript_51143/g.118869 Transcript_51143/m.118869 type:complete len:95 (+) Transcript_51143:79-363(+)
MVGHPTRRDTGASQTSTPSAQEAHVLVMSASSFSIVGALLNPHCVIHPGGVNKPHDGWMQGVAHKRPAYDKELVSPERSGKQLLQHQLQQRQPR